MEVFTKENLRMENLVVLARVFIMMGKNTLENGEREKYMVTEYCSINIKEKEYRYWKMGMYSKEISKMGCAMA